ncbi:MAG: DUF3833 family protein [Gemmatimonadaceae bacterium]|nr:DUF3833 family protein [Gemmatimonadaceae bacterium]
MESFEPAPALQSTPVLDPTVFFAGRTRGDGHLRVRVGADQIVKVNGVGRMEPDGRFRLDQRVERTGGDVESRTWFMTRTASNRFVASLSDASGDVHGEVDGSRFHVRYRIRQPAVYMEQWMYLQPDGRTVRNFAQVTVLGVPWARLTETIVRQLP